VETGDTMTRLGGPWLVLAVLLAASLPLEHARCHCEAIQAQSKQRGKANAAAADHSCCAPGSAARPQPDRAATGCPCLQLPAGTVPQAVVATPYLVHPGFVLSAGMNLLAAPAAAPAPSPAPDLGSPPLPIACDAHRLRAPPLSA